MPTDDWMSQYAHTTLGDLILPGSHDAGTTKNYIDLTIGGSNSNAATQHLTIVEQLGAGTRFFDLRLTEHKKQVVAHHTTAGQGAYSNVPVDTVLQEVATWCGKHKSEVAIFRISHTALSTGAHTIARASAAGALHTGTGNLCTKTLQQITSQGGGLICVFDEEKFGGVINQAQGIHGFTKYSNSPANDRGISTCGCYKGAHDLHTVIRNGLKGQFEHNAIHSHQHEHLWQVYWQKTYKNPLSSTGIQKGTTKGAYRKNGKVHGGTQAATGYMLRMMQSEWRTGQADFKVRDEESHREGLLRKKVVDRPAVMYSTLDARLYSLPNIFSYDFVNSTTNQEIIDMNAKLVLPIAGNDDD